MKFALLPAVAFAVVTSAQAQALPTGVQKMASMGGITEYDFPNGLRVLLFPDGSNPKVTVNMTYLVGSRHEGYGESGMAHLLEHLNFILTTKGRDIKKELTSHGAVWNGSTSDDRTNYYETFIATDENLRWALGLEADRMVNMRMEKTLLDTEMTVVRNEFERGENSPQRVLTERVASSAFLWHNYGKSTIGSREDIERVPIDRLVAFYRKYYQPDNAVLAIAGKIDEAKTLQMVMETCGSIPRPTRKLDADYTVEPVQDGQRSVELRRVGDGQELIVAYHIPASAHPDFAALEVLAGIMSGGGFRGGFGGGAGSGRLYKALVDNKKAISARMSAEQEHDPSLAMVSAGLNNEQSLEEARRIVIDTVEGLPKEPPTKEEVDRVKQRLLRATENSMTDSQTLGLSLSEWAARGDWRLLFLNRDRVAKVTPHDVVRVAKAYFKESNRTVGEFIPMANPDRAAIPATPDLAALFKDYKSELTVSQGEQFDPTPANIERRIIRHKLSNGMKLAVLPRETRGGTVDAIIELHFGDAQSLAGKTAVAQIVGGLLMRGTKNKTRQQLQDEMDKLNARILVSGGGGDAGAGRRGGRGGPATASSASSATASIQTTTGNLPAAIRLAVEMLREPAFNESDFEQVKQQRIATIEASRNEPGSLATEALQAHISPYPRGDVRHVATIAEQIEELKAVTIENVRQFHQKFYGASHGETVVLGPVDTKLVQSTVSETLGNWSSAAPYSRVFSAYQPVGPMNKRIDTPDKTNATFEAALRIKMSEKDADYAAMVLANHMFGGSLGSRMPNRIRNVEGLSYSVSSRFSAPADGDAAVFSASAISAPQNTAKVEASFVDELRKTLKGGFTAEEVATAKKAYHDERIVARSQESALARTILAHEQYDRTMKWDAELDAKIDALTMDQINAAFRRNVNPDALSIVKAGDFK
ncbi:MAG TPA: pitrilysin family protein [Bryobacteraceae bacterium]|jgi:zinc protease